MANNVNIFDKYGIKEVANVYFEALEDDIKAGVYKGDIVLFLDTLKVSTIETTAENTAAQGGWGNPKLVQWDYGKEINITLEDALMSLESLRFMLGGAIRKPGTDAQGNTQKVVVRHTEEVVCDSEGKVPLPKDHLTGVIMHPVAKFDHPIRLINLTKGTRTQIVVESAQAADKYLDGNKVIAFVNPALIGASPENSEAGDHIRIFWEEVLENNEGNETAVEVTISPDTFPGTYKVVGDTFMRSEKTGKDEPFQFIINKAKVQSNVTLTLQAEGDPTTFEMTLNVLRSTNDAGENEMMKLVRYNIASSTSSGAGNDYTTTAFSGSLG
jgi:hypothetical protein